MAKVTEELLNQITQTANLENYITQHEAEFEKDTVASFLDKMIAKKQLRIADIAARSGKGDYVYKVIQGTRSATRDILLAIAIGMQLEIEETQSLLKIAGTATLNPRNRRDSIVIYGIANKLKITEICEILYDFKEKIF